MSVEAATFAAPERSTVLMLRGLFLDHPESLGETYFQHQRRAASVGTTMIAAGAAGLIHAVVPAWFPRTGSRAIERLDRVLAVRSRPS